MADERAHLAQADRQIAKARERIRRQQGLIDALLVEGRDVAEAENFLAILTGTLHVLERHRLLILARLEA